MSASKRRDALNDELLGGKEAVAAISSVTLLVGLSSLLLLFSPRLGGVDGGVTNSLSDESVRIVGDANRVGSCKTNWGHSRVGDGSCCGSAGEDLDRCAGRPDRQLLHRAPGLDPAASRNGQGLLSPAAYTAAALRNARARRGWQPLAARCKPWASQDRAWTVRTDCGTRKAVSCQRNASGTYTVQRCGR